MFFKVFCFYLAFDWKRCKNTKKVISTSKQHLFAGQNTQQLLIIMEHTISINPDIMEAGRRSLSELPLCLCWGKIFTLVLTRWLMKLRKITFTIYFHPNKSFILNINILTISKTCCCIMCSVFLKLCPIHKYTNIRTVNFDVNNRIKAILCHSHSLSLSLTYTHTHTHTHTTIWQICILRDSFCTKILLILCGPW